MVRLKLTLQEIREAFPEEIKEIVPRVIRQLEKELKYYKYLRSIKLDQALQHFTPEYARQLAEEEMPKEKVDHLRNLKLLLSDSDNQAVSEVQIQRAKGVDIRTLYEFKKARTYGTRFVACCPFHSGGNEKTASFMINQRNQFKCFSCGEFGSSIDFIMKLNKLKFVEAVKFLNKV